MGPFYYLFIGAFIGLAIGEIISNAFIARDSKYRVFGMIASYTATFALCIYIFSINAGFISLGIILVVAALSIYMSIKPTQRNRKKKDYLYINHCWNCNNPIDSRVDIKCPRCHKHYICPKCGKCYCDSDEYKRMHGGNYGQE